MEKALFSENWYRVKSLQPKLRSHIKLHRHEYRQQVWYVLEDKFSNRFHRFNIAAYQMIGLMNGQRTVHQLWEEIHTQLGDDAPVQDEIIQLLGQLHSVDALQTNISPDVEELFERGQKYERQQRISRFKNPLSLRLPLFDPDRLLDKTLPYVARLYSKPVFYLWLLLALIGLTLVGSHWAELTETAKAQAMMPSNLFMLWLIYPLVKLLHEFGHAYAAKLQGGEVHEIGIMLLVFIPVPYVDASAATAFRSKHNRMVVGAAGIMVEILLAVLALLLWLNIEPGLISSICFNIMLIGGVSTIFFNGNPLLRFDGYYVLADALEIPNLSQRANRYVTYLIQHHIFGMEQATSPATSQGEAKWLFGYAVSSFAYRMMILVIICLFLIDQLFVAGVLLAAWAIFNQILLPLLKQFRFVLFAPQLRRHRQRAVLTSSALVVVLAAVIFLLPFSSLSRFEGVVWPGEESQLITDIDGFVTELLVEPGATVSNGQPLIRLENPQLQSQLAIKKARLLELSAQYSAARVSDQVEANLVQDKIDATQADIARQQQKVSSLLITSPSDGVFVAPRAKDLPGQFVPQGQLLGYVTNNQSATARVLVLQQDFERISQHLEAIELRLASEIEQIVPGKLIRQVPQASQQLPSKVLSVEGGGPFAPDPNGQSELITRERLFEYEIQLPLPIDQALIGTRVYVRFDHGSETLASRWKRNLQQLFLRRLNG